MLDEYFDTIDYYVLKFICRRILVYISLHDIASSSQWAPVLRIFQNLWLAKHVFVLWKSIANNVIEFYWIRSDDLLSQNI